MTTRGPRVLALTLAVALLGATAVVVEQPVALAAGTCTTSSGTTTCVFASFTGSSQTWTVPANVSSVTFSVYGAQGGGNNAHAGGTLGTGTFAKGGETTYTASVVPGQVFDVVVGGAGTYETGGFNGGGVPAASTGAGGGGGGSDVWNCGTTASCTSYALLLVAGGGGGSEQCGLPGGLGGGTTGGPGSSATTVTGYGHPGQGGTQSAGGAGGAAGTGGPTGATAGTTGRGTTSPTAPGTGGTGGTGATFTSTGDCDGGGGGGGYYGGGGGGGGDEPAGRTYGDGGPGGGGSGYGPSGAILDSGVQKGSGKILVAYATPTPPSITSTSSTTFTVGFAGTFQVTASGVPQPTYSETGPLPHGVTFSSSGLLSGTPSAGTSGVYNLTVDASNGVTPPAHQSFTLTVHEAPTITSADHTTFTVGAAGAFPVTVSSTTDPAPTYSETGALPGGVTFSSSGLLSGTPSAGTSGVYNLTVDASNGVTPPAHQSFTLTVHEATTITVERVYGQTADATAARELETAFSPSLGRCPGTAATRPVVLATDASYPDALSSAYLAASLSTGTLLTPTGALSPATTSGLQAEGITHVVVVGGPLAVSTAVVAALARTPVFACGGTALSGTRDITVTRIAGPSEYATATLVAMTPPQSFVGTTDLAGAYATKNALGGGGLYNQSAGTSSLGPSLSGELRTAILATGTGFQDAESAATLSYASQLPLLLTTPSTLSSTAASALQSLHIAQVLLMGGPLAVSDSVVSALEAMGVSVLRVAGATARATTIELAQAELGSATSHLGVGWAPTGGLSVARGDYWSDGLAGAALATRAGAGGHPEPLVLTKSPSTPGTALGAFLVQVGASGIDHDEDPVSALTVLGGPDAVTPAAISSMESALSR